MSTELDFLLQLMSDHLMKRKTLPRSDLDWNVMRKLSTSHEVAGIVYSQCKDWLPANQIESFRQAYTLALYIYANRKSELQRIRQTLSSSGIQLVTAKGLDVAQFYPIPALRTMGDLDIIIQKRDKQLADKLLNSLGFKSQIKNPNYDWIYFKDGLEYELHHQLFYEYDKDINDPAQVRFFNDFWPYVTSDELDWSFHFLFLLVHLKKHIMLYGAGFRMFFDLAVIIHGGVYLNWQWIAEKIQEFKIKQFADTCFALIETWFGIRAPVKYPNLSKELTDRLTERVAADGVFGFSDAQNMTNVDVNAIVKSNGVRWISRASIFLRKAFPGYKRIAYTKEYSFVENKPWLVPVAWVYRFYRLSRGWTESVHSIIGRVMTSDDLISEREAEMREWGLLK